MRPAAIALAVAALAITPTAARPEIKVTDTQGGCFYHRDASYHLQVRANGFDLGTRFVSAEDLRRIRSTLLAADDGRNGIPENLGITSDSVSLHRQTILDAALRGDSVTPHVLPDELQGLLNFDSVRGILLEELDDAAARGELSTNSCTFSVELPGDPVVVATSRQCRPWMLPWTIRAGDREWRTWSPAVPDALRQFAAKKSPNASLLDGSRYWREGVWSDATLWAGRLRNGLGASLNAYHARRLAESLDGWNEAATRFEIARAETGMINFAPLALVLSIEAKRAASLDGARWWNPLAQGAPTVSWREFLSVWQRVEAKAAALPWLADWRAQDHGTIVLEALGPQGHGPRSLEDWVLPAWRDAGLLGEPEFELSLTGAGSGYAKVYVATNESRSIITYAALKSSGSHWLSNVSLSYHPTKPDYLLVMPEGHHERRRVQQR